MTRRLKKVTIRLPEGLPERLSELTGLGYNEAIRGVLQQVVAKLERQAGEAGRRHADSIDLESIL